MINDAGKCVKMRENVFIWRGAANPLRPTALTAITINYYYIWLDHRTTRGVNITAFGRKLTLF